VTLSFVFLDERLTLVQLGGGGGRQRGRGDRDVRAGSCAAPARRDRGRAVVGSRCDAVQRRRRRPDERCTLPVGALDAITLRIARSSCPAPVRGGQSRSQRTGTLRPTPAQWRTSSSGRRSDVRRHRAVVLGMKYTWPRSPRRSTSSRTVRLRPGGRIPGRSRSPRGRSPELSSAPRARCSSSSAPERKDYGGVERRVILRISDGRHKPHTRAPGTSAAADDHGIPEMS